MDSPPKLPQQVSPDGREIWDWAVQAGAWVHRQARIRELRAELRELPLECGSCCFWMQSRNCPRERNVNGRNHGPSMSSPICDKFQMTDTTKVLMQEREVELASLLKENT